MEPFSQEYRIRSSWTVRCQAGEPFALVRVRNLQTAIQGPQDAWGRQNKAQPLLVSADVCFSRPFEAAAANDKVSSDTVHYGTLSKTVLASLQCYSPQAAAAEQQVRAPITSNGGPTLRDVLEKVWSGLTGLKVDGIPYRGTQAAKPLLDISQLRSMTVTVFLPKGSLLGEGVGLTATSVFQRHDRGPLVDMFGIALQIRNLRVPTLIGVNSNERLSKQVVVASVHLDKFDYAPDVYTSLESLIVKSMEESAFETLEALGSYLARKIMSDFKPLPGQTYSGYFGWQIKISLEKPTAVTMAEAAVVEIRAGADTPLQTTPN